MIRITNNNKVKLKTDYNNKWRESTDAQRLMGNSINSQNACSTPQSDVDAIANAMDKQEEIPNVATPQSLTTSPLENDINVMMQNYIRQNGGIIQDNNKVKRNQTLLG